jgi:hypothetical protein
LNRPGIRLTASSDLGAAMAASDSKNAQGNKKALGIFVAFRGSVFLMLTYFSNLAFSGIV